MGHNDYIGQEVSVEEFRKRALDAQKAAEPFKKNEPVLAIIDDTIALEALDDFIVVQEDKFRTGYECKTCDGSGHSDTPCKVCNGTKVEIISDTCLSCAGTGKVNDLFREIGEPQDIIKKKKCKECSGTGKIDLQNMQAGLYPCRNCMVVTDVTGTGGRTHSSGFEKCHTCKGQSVALVVPEDSIRRPSSGIVRSTGPKAVNLKCGERVLYSNHTGYEIYFKRGLKFRQMREHEVMSRIHGLGEIHKVLE